MFIKVDKNFGEVGFKKKMKVLMLKILFIFNGKKSKKIIKYVEEKKVERD